MRRRSRAERGATGDQRREIQRELERAGAPLTPDEIAQRLRVHGSARREFDAGIAALERAGDVVQNRAGALLIAKRIALVAGRVEGHPDGHGFLIPDEGGAPVFLAAAEMRQLMHGDRAAVRVGGRDQRGRPVGAVVEVLERANRRIVGR
ncbi:MAG TPA: ribonuclease R, partial [Burkholderiales bacterium]|nr:ribonuclease R [Burkholderiales bacterium]